jgi:hypothetical protein
MSAKFDKFKAALIALCDEHGVMLATSEYDIIQVWDRGADIDNKEAIYGGQLEDRTAQ